MEIRKGNERDIPAVTEIINAAKEDCRKNGIDQWQRGVPNGETLKNDMANGENYVVSDGRSVLATAMISLRGEPTYSRIYGGNWQSDAPYGVIHRVAVRPDAKKGGLASLLVKEAEKITLEAGFCSLRADTHERNIPMRGMLEKNGFVYRGTIFLSDGSPRRAYEKILK